MKNLRANRVRAYIFISLAALLMLLGQSNSAGAQTHVQQRPADTQYFQDVALDSFWYNYTATLYQAGITSGYQCGTPPAGQCVPPNNLPYYLPNQNVSRGQMAKFIGLSLGNFPDVTTHTLTISHSTIGPGEQNGVYAAIDSTGSTADGHAGEFINYGGTSRVSYGIYASASSYGGAQAIGGKFRSEGGGSGDQIGLFGEVTTMPSANTAYAYGVIGSAPSQAGGVGGAFGGGAGLVANGAGGIELPYFGDGIDVGAVGAPDTTHDAIYSRYPQGSQYYTLLGEARIQGATMSAGDYEVEVQYHGDEPAAIGDVLALDGNNTTADGRQVLGVVRADASNAAAAVGVLSYRLGSAKVQDGEKPYIDSTATSVAAGDYAYITVVGQARMKVSGKPAIGSRVALGSDGRPDVTTKGGDSAIIGKIASAPDPTGYVTVFVNLK